MLGAVAAVFFAGPLAGQDPRGLSLVAGLAYERGGPGPSLVQELAEAGLDDPRVRPCFPQVPCTATEYPFYFDDGLDIAAMVGARYRWDRPFSIQAVLSNGRRGHAEGYQEEPYDHVLVRYASFLTTVSFGLHLGSVRLEAGPALNATNWSGVRRNADPRKGTVTELGAAGGVSVGFRAADVQLAVRAGGHMFPSTDLGNSLLVPLRSEYRSFYVGVSILPWHD